MHIRSAGPDRRLFTPDDLLHKGEIVAPQEPDEILAVNEALQRLEDADPESAEIVKMRFFAGMQFQEIADLLGVNRKTVNRRWNFARAWLYKELRED